MKQIPKNKCNNYSSIRIKEETKKELSKIILNINNTEDCGRVSPDDLINYFLLKMTSEDIKNIQTKSITWAHEDRRLKRLWEKKKGKVSENKWKEMLYIGQLVEFIENNSRLKIEATSA